MKSNSQKIIPKIIEGIILPVSRPDFNLRWEMCRNMREVDADVNFYSIRPLSHEFMNFIDGKHSVEKIASAVGYEYNIKIDEKNVLLLLKDLEKRGLIKLHRSEID